MMWYFNREQVKEYYNTAFTSDLFSYFEISNWKSDKAQFCVSEDTCFVNLYQRKSSNVITPVCYSWKAAERDFMFSGIFAYLYIAQKSIAKYSNRESELTFNKVFSFPELQDFCPKGYFDIVVALKEATLAPTKAEAEAYLRMLDVVVPYMREQTKPHIDAIDENGEITRSIDTSIANLREWVANTNDELVSFYGILLRKEYYEDSLYNIKYFSLDSFVDTLQKAGVYSHIELSERPLLNDSPLPNSEIFDGVLVAHYVDVKFVIDYNNQEKDVWYLRDETPEEKQQSSLYNILINTLWEDEKFCENGKYGIKDCRGRVILPAVYDDCLGGLSSASYISPEEMVIAVKQGDKWGFIKRNSSLEQVVDFKYDLIEETMSGVYATKIGNHYGLTGKRGIEILPTEMEDICRPSYEGHIIYKQDGKYGFRMRNKSRSTELFDEVNVDGEEYLSVCRNGEWGYIDENAQFTFDKEEAVRNIGFSFETMIDSTLQVELTQEMIDNLPVIENDEFLSEEEMDTLIDDAIEDFSIRCDIIDEMYDKYKGTLSDDQITEKINEKFRKMGYDEIPATSTTGNNEVYIETPKELSIVRLRNLIAKR